MSGRLWRFLLLFVAFGILSLVSQDHSSAQSTYFISLTSPDKSQFPHMTAYLDVLDPSGGFVHGLTLHEVAIQENGVSIPVTDLTEQKPGVQFVIAISPGATFVVRDASGTTRYESLLNGILAGSWTTQTAGDDDLSLLTLDGPLVTHTSDPARLQSGLVSYIPDDSDTTPGLEVLASAVELVSIVPPRPGMKRAILFITPPQSTEVTLGLQSILSSASQQNIHIFVWLVAPAEALNLPETDLLRNMANQTYATFFAFSHDEPVPDLETLLEPLRYVYQLEYDSHITTGGVQQVAAQVTMGEELITSNTQTFDIDLRSPSPVILNLQNEIKRYFALQPTPGTVNTSGDLLPKEQPVRIQVKFQDGYPRQLIRTSLFVDGSLVAENTTPPFDQFQWDLRPYTQAGSHTLRVEAVDSLGLVGQSNEVSVKITVPSTTQEVVTVVSQKRLQVIGITVLISVCILVLVLIAGGRIRPKPYPGQIRGLKGVTEKIRSAGYGERMRNKRNPVKPAGKAGSNFSVNANKFLKAWLGRLPWFGLRETAESTLANLMPLVGTGEPTLLAPLDIKVDNVTIGSDPQKAELVIADPSIEGLHARIHREENIFIITDVGSTAGTWVNYEQVAPDGTNLFHADIIHLGRIGFRFHLSDPGTPRKVIVTPLEPDK
jgi:FHA domain